MMRDLDDEGLSQNKVLYNSSEVKLPMVKLPLQALDTPCARETDLRLSAGFWLLELH